MMRIFDVSKQVSFILDTCIHDGKKAPLRNVIPRSLGTKPEVHFTRPANKSASVTFIIDQATIDIFIIKSLE